MKYIKDVRISHIEKIMKLSKKTFQQVRKMNAENYPAYAGKDLSKAQLIFQLTFGMDSPEA